MAVHNLFSLIIILLIHSLSVFKELRGYFNFYAGSITNYFTGLNHQYFLFISLYLLFWVNNFLEDC